MSSVVICIVSSDQLGEVQPQRSRIMDLGWTDAEVLVVVYQNGTVELYAAMPSQVPHQPPASILCAVCCVLCTECCALCAACSLRCVCC
jgi:hypothetical protein